MIRLARLLIALFAFAGAASAFDCNPLVLETLREMPHGGAYSVGKASFQGLGLAIRAQPEGLVIAPSVAQPSFCSGATYLVFAQVMQRLHLEHVVTIEPAVLAALPAVGQRDGQGIWGRWNANGPGTARLFYELRLGRNFSDYAQARPGDFMKIFWTPEIGKKERGHSVIFLEADAQNVRYWSSNTGSTHGEAGYGERLIPRSKIARVIFSRLEAPDQINTAPDLPKVDPFLASMLTRSADMAEVKKMCGF